MSESRIGQAATARRVMAFALGGALLVGCLGCSPSPTPTPPPTATPLTPIPTMTAMSATVTFNDMMLDAAADPQAQARTFTFQSDGWGPVSAAVVKNKNASESTKLCLAVNGGTPTCQSGPTPSLSAQASVGQSTWVVTAISADNVTTPVVDIAIGWPAFDPMITLTHGRLQGSMSPGVPVELNGFNVTFKPRAAGNLSVAASWTVILTYIDVGLADVTGMPWINVDEQQYQGGGHGVGKIDPAYTHPVDPTKTYRFMLRNLSADNYRPDLKAQISFP